MIPAWLTCVLTLAPYALPQTDFREWLSSSIEGIWQNDLDMTSVFRGKPVPAVILAKNAAYWQYIKLESQAAQEPEDLDQGLSLSIKDSEATFYGYIESWDPEDGEVGLGIFEIRQLPGRLVMCTGKIDERVHFNPTFDNLHVMGDGRDHASRLILIPRGFGKPWGEGRVNGMVRIPAPPASSVLLTEPPVDPLASLQEHLSRVQALADQDTWAQIIASTTHPLKLEREIEEAERQGGTEAEYFTEYEFEARRLVEVVNNLDIETAVVRVDGRYVIFDQPTKGTRGREWVWIKGSWVEREKAIAITKFTEARLRKDRPYLFREEDTE